MAPSAVTPPDTPTTVSSLNQNGIKHTLKETAPSVLHNGPPLLQELDAAKLTYAYTKEAQEVPKPGSEEVWSQSMLVT